MYVLVTEFARKTGDLHSLSTADVRVAALVYTLEKELVGTEHIRTEPTNKVLVRCPLTDCCQCSNSKSNRGEKSFSCHH